MAQFGRAYAIWRCETFDPIVKSMWFGGSAWAIEDKVFFALICIHQVIAISILGLALSMFGMGIVGADRS